MTAIFATIGFVFALVWIDWRLRVWTAAKNREEGLTDDPTNRR